VSVEPLLDNVVVMIEPCLDQGDHRGLVIPATWDPLAGQLNVRVVNRMRQNPRDQRVTPPAGRPGSGFAANPCCFARSRLLGYLLLRFRRSRRTAMPTPATTPYTTAWSGCEMTSWPGSLFLRNAIAARYISTRAPTTIATAAILVLFVLRDVPWSAPSNRWRDASSSSRGGRASAGTYTAWQAGHFPSSLGTTRIRHAAHTI
jgi:hypothetical protein